MFLGCPLRMVLRMAAGDLNAWVALIGFAGGVADVYKRQDVALENVPQGDCRRCNARKRVLRANLSGKRTEMNLFL